MKRGHPLRRIMVVFLLVLVGLYAAVCGLLWARQDAFVFPGAGRGDRGLPAAAAGALVQWVGATEAATRIAVVQPAAGQPVRMVAVYFGGNGEDLFAAATSAVQLARYGAEVVAAEHPGYGASRGRPGVASLLAAAEAVVARARARAQELQVPLVVFGSSLGTFCAMHVAAAGGVDRLVLRAPPSTLAGVAQQHFPWLPVGLLLRHRFDNLAPARRVACPTLVVHGDRDGIVPLVHGQQVAAALPDARLVPVAGGGHNDLDLSPDGSLANELRAFLPR